LDGDRCIRERHYFLIEIPGTGTRSPRIGDIAGERGSHLWRGASPPFADAQVTMTLAIRFLPNPGRKVIYTVSGRAYPSTGATVDIPFPDAETIQPDQATRLMIIGTTADRPVNVPGRINWPPREMYDTTLGAPIFLVPGSNPVRWVNITGTAV
jgi:hypothetical protein